MKGRLNRSSPVPLYHQIAEALRNAIAVGDLIPGARLPPVRAAAREWGVNLHTVRRAYAELQEDGLVLADGARGTQVVERLGAPPTPGGLDGFLDACVRTALERFDLDASGLGRLLLERTSADSPPFVFFLECSHAQAAGHCGELERAWRVTAEPLVLSEIDDLPIGPVVATYFHYNEVRQRWPERLDEVQFVAIAPDSALAARILSERTTGRPRLLVCEYEETKAKNIAADLRNVLRNEEYLIEPRVINRAPRLPRSHSNDVILVAPRVWGALNDRQRERVVPIHYHIRPREIERLGRNLNWQRR